MFRDKLVSLKEKDNFDKALTVLVADDWGIDNMIEKLEGTTYNETTFAYFNIHSHIETNFKRKIL